MMQVQQKCSNAEPQKWLSWMVSTLVPKIRFVKGVEERAVAGYAKSALVRFFVTKKEMAMIEMAMIENNAKKTGIG